MGKSIKISASLLVLLAIILVASFLTIDTLNNFGEAKLADSLLLAPGDFEYRSHNITEKYSAGEKIKGFVNLSFEEFDANARLTSNLEGNISLLDFLEAALENTCR